MKRLILKTLNAPLLLLILILGVAVQTSLFSWYPLSYFQPDIALIAVIWFALRRPFTEGGVLTLIAAQIAEIHSAVPKGVFLTTYMATYLLIRFSINYLMLNALSTRVYMTLAASAFWKLLGLAILHLLDASENIWRQTLYYLVPGAAINGIVGVWCYRWLEKFDIATFKDPSVEKSLEEELLLEGEGL